MKKTFTGFALLVGAGLTACGDDSNPLTEIVEGICPALTCNTYAEVGGSVSGIPSIDAFFSAAVNFEAEAAILEAEVAAALERMAVIAGAEVDADIGTTAANIAAKVEAGFDGKLDGSITASFEPPRCEISAEATIDAAASCDVDIEPGEVTVECQGRCEAEASVMAECSADVELKCTGTAPSFECTGTCQGACEVAAGAECSGTCKGTCELDGTAACDGECLGTEEGGMCTGECDLNAGASCEGTCKGTCELEVAAECTGECKGECTYTAPEAGCEGGAKATCEGSASASVECEGECKGDVVPPAVDAECEASVQAEANFEAECFPPSLALSYELNAELQADAEASAEFEAELEAFGTAYAELLASGAKLELVLDAGNGLIAAAEGAVESTLREIEADGSIAVVFGAACALEELPNAGSAIESGVSSVTSSGDAVAAVSGAIGS